MNDCVCTSPSQTAVIEKAFPATGYGPVKGNASYYLYAITLFVRNQSALTSRMMTTAITVVAKNTPAIR